MSTTTLTFFTTSMDSLKGRLKKRRDVMRALASMLRRLLMFWCSLLFLRDLPMVLPSVWSPCSPIHCTVVPIPIMTLYCRKCQKSSVLPWISLSYHWKSMLTSAAPYSFLSLTNHTQPFFILPFRMKMASTAPSLIKSSPGSKLRHWDLKAP